MRAALLAFVLGVIFSSACVDEGSGGRDGQALLPDGPAMDGGSPDTARVDIALPDAPLPDTAPLKPSSEWVVTAGGGGLDQGMRVVMDSAGNAYLTGYFQGTVNFGSHSLKSKGTYDLFVAKLDPAGKFLWVVSAGSSLQTASGSGIALDSAGNIHVAGTFSGTVSFGTHQLTAKGKSDIFVAKLSAGGKFLWAARAGGTMTDEESGFGIAVDGKGNVLVTGVFHGKADFGSASITSAGKSDIFVAKLDSGGTFVWAVGGGGVNEDGGWDIEVDGKGNSHISGSWNGPKAVFGHTELTSTMTKQGRLLVFKLDASGKFLWTSGSWGTSNSTGAAITLDSAGNSYVAGSFGHLATFGALSINSAGGWDAMVVKLDPAGKYIWATRAGGLGDDLGSDLHLDNTGNIYLAGMHEGNATFGSTTLTSHGTWDIYAAKLDAKGKLLWALGAGGSSYDQGTAVAAVPAGGALVTGWFTGAATFGSTTVSGNSMADVFIWKVAEKP